MTVLVIADDDGLLHQLPDASAEVLVSCGDLYEQVESVIGATRVIGTYGYRFLVVPELN